MVRARFVGMLAKFGEVWRGLRPVVSPWINTPHGLRCAFQFAQLVDFIATFFLEAVGVRDAAKLGAYNEPAVRDSRFHVRVLALRSDFEE